MRSQKRMKTENSEVEMLHKKKASYHLRNKNSIQLKSTSKELTPIKQKKSKKMQMSTKQKDNLSKSKNLQSLISVNEKDTVITKRKSSKIDLENKIRGKTGDFKILSNCLREFTFEEKKAGRFPCHEQIIHFIKAFNKSQIRPISKELHILIKTILDSIEDSIHLQQQRQKNESSGKKLEYQEEIEVLNSTNKQEKQEIDVCKKQWLEDEQANLENMNKQLLQLRNVGNKLKGQLRLKSEEEKRRLEILAAEQQKIISIMNQDQLSEEQDNSDS